MQAVQAFEVQRDQMSGARAAPLRPAPAGVSDHIGYRPDIDGLRAIAVLPVVLFHAGIGLFGGGFVGVDIFFVISGYLITAVIYKEVQAGDFSILRFYERRARRIFPALFATVAAVFAAGWLIFLPDELRNASAGIAAAAVFASNILFWEQVSYFGGAAELRPLLHTWSLAVEEQFYIFFPLVLLLVARSRSQRFRLWTALIAAASFVVSLAWVTLDQPGAYYLLPSRAWELLLGALLALGAVPAIRSRAAAEVAGVVGLALIAGSVLLLSEESLFPGLNALWPCLGAALLIHSGQRGTRVAAWLGSRPLVAIGLVSYSLYLVHWPVIVYTRYVLLRAPAPLEIAAMLAAMAVLAWASWRFVEQPFRNRRRVSNRAIWVLSGGAIAITFVVGVATFRADGWPQRLPAEARAMVAAAKVVDADPKCFLEGTYEAWGGSACFLVRNPGPRVLLWGDSHANHYVPAIRTRAATIDASVLQYTSAGCLPVLGVEQTRRDHCTPNSRQVPAIIRRFGIDRVVLSANWDYGLEQNGLSLDEVRSTVAQLRAMGVDVRIIGDNPDFSFSNPAFLAYRLSQRDNPQQPFFIGTRNDWAVNEALAEIAGPGKFVNPSALLCPDPRRCLVYDGRQSLMMDNAHFSPAGADWVMRRTHLGLD